MLSFFRKYQRVFFIMITIVVVITFSFFGTYDALSKDLQQDPVAFKAIDGKEVTQLELDEMMLFIGTDAKDKLLFGGVWGPNFLNDGVIRKDFLANGLAEVLLANHRDLLKNDLETRLAKEKRYSSYVHPQAKFLSAEAAWSYFAPQIKANYDLLIKSQQAEESSAFAARVRLFLAEGEFPSYALRHILRYQESQYEWLQADPYLAEQDLSLFGYHTTEDWFGRQFIQLVAKSIINAAKLAEERGYEVSKAEALADLSKNADESYRHIKNNNQEVLTSGSAAYMQEQLRRMGMDQTRAAKIWRQVLLARRLFQETGQSVFVDPVVYEPFEAYAKESALVDLYRLPQLLRLGDYHALQKFEIYLRAVGREFALLALPMSYLPARELAKKWPELVQKRYLLEIASVDKKTLQSKVSIKDAWGWEIEETNWKKLSGQFPEIGASNALTIEQRYAALDNLDSRTRSRVDAVARSALVEEHPEWLEEALNKAPLQKMTLAVRLQGGELALKGVKDRQELIQLLDKVPLDAGAPLLTYSGDNTAYYRLRVLKRSQDLEVLTYAEANAAGALDQLFAKEQAGLNLDALLKAVYQDAAVLIAAENMPKEATGDFAASHRFYHYAQEIKETLDKRPAEAVRFVVDVTDPDSFEGRIAVENQWKFVSSEVKSEKSTADESLALQQAFQMTAGSWSAVHVLANGDTSFFKLKERGSFTDEQAIRAKMDEAQRLLGSEAQRLLLDYLNKQQ